MWKLSLALMAWRDFQPLNAPTAGPWIRGMLSESPDRLGWHVEPPGSTWHRQAERMLDARRVVLSRLIAPSPPLLAGLRDHAVAAANSSASQSWNAVDQMVRPLE